MPSILYLHSAKRRMRYDFEQNIENQERSKKSKGNDSDSSYSNINEELPKEEKQKGKKFCRTQAICSHTADNMHNLTQ